jgi:hypothetical protein
VNIISMKIHAEILMDVVSVNGNEVANGLPRPVRQDPGEGPNMAVIARVA